eukprot:2524862-Rhodomonas_salina.1
MLRQVNQASVHTGPVSSRSVQPGRVPCESVNPVQASSQPATPSPVLPSRSALCPRTPHSPIHLPSRLSRLEKTSARSKQDNNMASGKGWGPNGSSEVVTLPPLGSTALSSA